mmetsp:Transcript_9784/g.5111  ORF Transcript_9784/g.5111 Transcript_9784/m.5111 type:complete len:101 (-) Transcript_9784:678-980(-)
MAVAGADVIMLAVETVVFGGLVFVFEYLGTLKEFRAIFAVNLPEVGEEQIDDEDIAKEREKALTTDPSTLALKTLDLRKIYGNKWRGKSVLAVDGISFTV